jgi:uncharacterized membrane protein
MLTKGMKLVSGILGCLLTSTAFGGYTLCNYSSVNVDVAFSFVHPEQSNNWVSAGWKVVNSGQCALLINYDLTKMYSRIYYHAISNDGSNLMWAGNQNFCVKVGQAFTIFYADHQCNGGTYRGFRLTNIPVGVSNYTQTIND